MKDFGKESRILGGLDSWILLAVVGILVGAFISWLDVVTAFLSDIKHGICSTDWYLSKDICCKGVVRDGLYCDNYESWSVYFLGSSVVVVDFMIYVLLAVIMGVLASFLVKKLDMYAADSGLPEIKTILGGFIIKGYFSMKTMVVKAISLSLAISSGLCIGKEAVMIHLACCIGHNVQSFFPSYRENEVKKRLVLSGIHS
jgi:chloride channel 3/4/5